MLGRPRGHRGELVEQAQHRRRADALGRHVPHERDAHHAGKLAGEQHAGRNDHGSPRARRPLGLAGARPLAAT
jgi:hypothetical protein